MYTSEHLNDSVLFTSTQDYYINNWDLHRHKYIHSEHTIYYTNTAYEMEL